MVTLPEMWKITLTVLTAVATAVIAAPEVNIGKTKLIGVDLAESKVEFFGGIPFAEPPVGKLRFRPPILKTRLDTATLQATDYGKACLQLPLLGPPWPGPISEDCLTINIHRPSGVKPGDKLPVLFWVYGGGFVIGGGNFNNGSTLAARSAERGTPIIYVNANYRLGPFGYPLGKEAHDRRALNLGLKDVIAALEWVHANIGAFGGDPRKITVFGESAGGMTIGALYLTKSFEKLVRGAILESGSANGPALFTASERESAWERFVASVPSCTDKATTGDTFSCLQGVSEEEIAASYLQPSQGGGFGLVFAPVLDSGRGSMFPDFPSRLYKQGKFARIPFIAGTNLDEGTALTSNFRTPNVTVADLRASILGSVSPPLADPAKVEKAVDKLLELYPPVLALGSPYRTGNQTFGLPPLYKRAASLQGDFSFDASRRQMSETAVEHRLKSYGYLFTQPQPGSDPARGVQHAAEIPFVYGIPSDPSPLAQELSVMMMDYWISFTVNLDPNDRKGIKRPIWPQYTKRNKVLIQLEGGNTTVIKDDYRKGAIDFINSNAHLFRR